MRKFLLLIAFTGFQTFGQESIQMTLQPVEINEDLKILLDFDNIGFDEVQFSGYSIQGKYYVLRLKEFRLGELSNTETLFDERGNAYFKLDSTFTSFKFLSRIGKENLKLWIRGNGFGSKQSHFKIGDKNGRYVVKDFLGDDRSIEVPVDKPFYIYAVITPNRNSKGFGSYCRVAQAEVDPEEFGKEFDIPHYFLVEMEFVEPRTSGL